ncbi:complement C3 isoform X2 [Kryptolebias marmoratus]|uniref:complement C3 isoform X2 n=1 Tax=Kryptolebias marmoratus TaxID=37003 RepID=UPI0007F88E9A|nr:complement C3 isoform X2 [Kryptolebias marmoratus]
MFICKLSFPTSCWRKLCWCPFSRGTFSYKLIRASTLPTALTPEGITNPSNWHVLSSGISSGQYTLPEIVSYGLWKVVAKFQGNPHHSFTAEFKVKEYVLPSFEVKLTPSSASFYIDREDLTVNIKATYYFGEEVDGTANVVFGVLDHSNKKSFPSSLQRVQMERGNGVAKLKREHITQTYPNIFNLVGSSIYVAVSVLAGNGGEMVETELRDIKIVTSPYLIHLRRTPTFFRPGTPFDITVEVVNPDDTPAQGVVVVVDPGHVQGVTAANGVARLTINTATGFQIMTITARTNDPQLSFEKQASASMTAQAYKSKHNNYLYINVDSTEVELGDNLKATVFLTRQESEEKDITYLILSRGQLVKHGRYKIRHQVLISLSLPITKDMLPSFRIVMYYHPNSDEVVADSVWVDVKDSCMGSLHLEPTRTDASSKPQQVFDLKITGDPNAIVGLVAVDKRSSALNNKHLLTQKQIWDLVEEYDTGCTVGGGQDSMGVFYDAGLLFETSTVPGTPYRTNLKCLVSSRRKRATTIINASSGPAYHHQDKVLSKCCLNGMRKSLVSGTCERHSRYAVNDTACGEAFVRCCKQTEQQRVEKKEGTVRLARSKRSAQDTTGGTSTNADLIRIRTLFPESWRWFDVHLSSCPQNKPDCVSSSYELRSILPQSLTTWQLTGISLTKTHGICVSEPLEVKVQQTFFIDLKLPYSAVQGEQLEFKAILYNYSPDPINVYVDLSEEEDVCSAAYERLFYRQEVQVGALTTRSVPIVILPMKVGNLNVEVKAAVKDSVVSDGIRKSLQVLPKGTLIKSVKIVSLNPTKDGVDGQQIVTINSEILPTNIAPNTPMSTVVTLTGAQMSPPIENIISGKFLGGMFVEPIGSGEVTMMRMTQPVVAVMYLDNTNQWEAVGFEKRNEGLQLIKNGYQRELDFRKSDGSFATFLSKPSSTWLTAYVAKVFSMAHNLVEMQASSICDAIKFLIRKAQRPTGMLAEVGSVYQTTMTGDVSGTDSDASMTAFCLVAMQESRKICAASVNSLESGISRAVTYLERRLPTLTNPYAVAMTSYALANENKLNKAVLLRFAAADKSHWPLRTNSHTLEATAYALLALVKAEVIEEAHPVARWLSQSSNLIRDSTQATIMVYQAVAEYWKNVRYIEYNLNVGLLIPNKAKPMMYHINEKNHYITRISKFKGINNDIIVTARGKGEATLRMVSLYYTLPKQQDSDCEMFNMNVKLIPEKTTDDEKLYRLTIDVMYKNENHDASFSVLSVGLPAGFTVNKDDLDSLSAGRSPSITTFDTSTAVSERGSLIIYLDKVSHTRPEQISFRIYQRMTGDIAQPVPVSVYEQYSKKSCVKFYTPEGRESLSTLCMNGQCVCAEGNCPKQRKAQFINDKRQEQICDPTSRVAYVYKVTVEDFTESLSGDIYTMRISQVIKEGMRDMAVEGKLRKFLGKKSCRDSLDLKTGKSYLIMGSSKSIQRDEETLSFLYILGENNWIEYWPTEEECQTETHRPVCKGIEEISYEYAIFGCSMG